MAQLTLILGGARSGKSDYGEGLAQSLGDDVLFVATAQPFDEEMETRITRHRQQRPAHWRTLEAPTRVAEAMDPADSSSVVLVDCLTLLVSNLLFTQGDDPTEAAVERAVAAELDALLALVQRDARHWIVISNEVGLGIVPENRLARLYRDVLGRANQRLARHADTVLFLVAGLPITVKG